MFALGQALGAVGNGSADCVAPLVAAAGAAPSAGFSAEVSISARVAPTSTVSPSPASTAFTRPEAGAGTSTSTLSVVMSTRVAPSSIHCPGLTRHSTTEPSVTDSPISGRVTLTMVSGTQGLRVQHDTLILRQRTVPACLLGRARDQKPAYFRSPQATYVAASVADLCTLTENVPFSSVSMGTSSVVTE